MVISGHQLCHPTMSVSKLGPRPVNIQHFFGWNSQSYAAWWFMKLPHFTKFYHVLSTSSIETLAKWSSFWLTREWSYIQSFDSEIHWTFHFVLSQWVNLWMFRGNRRLKKNTGFFQQIPPVCRGQDLLDSYAHTYMIFIYIYIYTHL